MLNLEGTGAAEEYVLRQKLFQIPRGKTEDKKAFWEEAIAYFPLILHEPSRKRHGQQFFNCCVCIRCRGNVF
jgi:hypothetical protein